MGAIKQRAVNAFNRFMDKAVDWVIIPAFFALFAWALVYLALNMGGIKL